MATLAYYRDRVPAHAAVGDAVVEAELADAAGQLSPSAWGDLYVNGVLWLAAHQVESTPGMVSGSTAATGQLLSQRDGDLAVTFANRSQGDADDAYRSTAYGVRYLALRNQLAAGSPFFAGVF